MPLKLNLLLLYLVVHPAFADVTNWTRVTTKSHPTCTHEVACRIMEANCSFEATFVTGDGNSANHLQALEIHNLKTGKTQRFEIDNVNNLDDGEFFELYRVTLKPGVTALALHAFDSAHEGPSYLYFFYDAKNQTFVKDPATSPKLSFDPKTGLFLSAVRHNKYKFSPDFKFEALD